VNALVRYPVLTVAEAVSLIAAGCALWLELVDSPPFLPMIGRPLRAAFAALPMWVIWASAYIMAFSHTVWFTAFRRRADVGGLSIAADQQIAAGLLWAITGLCFVPVVYVSLITWLRDTSDPDHELRRVPETGGTAGPPMPRPPRGWRLSR
jgi:cytochrome c oxidase assembly factor CtaG